VATRVADSANTSRDELHRERTRNVLLLPLFKRTMLLPLMSVKDR
jgi:hypothetical protein